MASLLKHTVKPSGGDFTTLDAAIDHLVASHANFVTADVYGEIEIGGDWSAGADTASVSVSGITMDATRYLHIYTDASNRAGLSWDTGKYQLLVANNVAFRMYASPEGSSLVRFDGIQVGLSAANAHEQCPVIVEGAGAGDTLWVSNCLIKQCGNNSYRLPCVDVWDSDSILYFWNNVCYGMGTTDHAINSCFLAQAGTSYVYSSVFIGGKYGINKGGAGTATVKNTYCGGTRTEDFYRSAGTLVKVNCASEDQSADDTSGADETATNCVAAAVAYDTSTFTNVTAGSEDFHLVVGSALIGAGTTTSGESAPLDFTTDIDGDTRS